MAALELVLAFLSTMVADWGDFVLRIADEIPI